MTQDEQNLFQVVRTSIESRPNDLDILGHVNNAVVLEYLEAARWHWAKRMGVELLGNVVSVVSRIEIDYLQQVHAGAIHIETQFKQPSDTWLDDTNYKVTAHQRLISPTGAVLVKADVTLAFLDAKAGTLCSVQDWLLTARVPAA